ncbi:long-chain fatty acid--CoA ligase, partial [Vibrio parahaemolyticus]
NITGVYVPLMLGVTSSILPGEQTGLLGSSQFEPRLFAQALATIKPESLVLTPALLLALIHIAKQQPSLVGSLKFVAVGGARVSSQLINTAHALNIPAFEGYGLSECGSV